MDYCKNYLILKEDKMQTVVTIPARYASQFSILVRKWAQELDAKEIQFGFSKYGEMHFRAYFDDYDKREKFCEKVNQEIGNEEERAKKVEISLFELFMYYEQVKDRITPIVDFYQKNGGIMENCSASGVSAIGKALKENNLPDDVRVSLVYLIKLLLKDKYYSNAFYDLTID